MTAPKSILIVDDDRVMAEELAEAISSGGYSARTAGSGESALEALVREPADLMLIDMKMPGIGGLETVRRAGRNHPGLKAILITAALPSEMEMTLGDHPGLTVLFKPFAIDQLLATIAAALATGENQPPGR